MNKDYEWEETINNSLNSTEAIHLEKKILKKFKSLD